MLDRAGRSGENPAARMRLHLLHPSDGQHPLHPHVDAAVELGPRRGIQAQDQGIVGRAALSLCLGERDSRGGEDLQGAYYSPDVSRLDAHRGLRVDAFEAAMQGCVALTLGQGRQLGAKVGLRRRVRRLPPLQQRPCVLASAAHEDG